MTVILRFLGIQPNKADSTEGSQNAEQQTLHTISNLNAMSQRYNYESYGCE